jgi:glycosyltransferase involved in cell wall biosynthesis
VRYWLLTSEYPPFFGGGISTYCYFTAKMLVEKGHAVTVFVNDASIGSIKVEEREGVRIVRFAPSRTRSSAFLGHVTNISYEFAAIVKHFIEKEGKPDIIEAQEYLGIAYYLLQFKYLQFDWCTDIRIVITAHSPSFIYLRANYVPTYRYPNFWIGEMEKFSLQAADLVISPSQFLLAELKKGFNFTNTNTIVIPNPYKAEKDDTAMPIPDERHEIIFYGKLSAQKGTFKLLEYFSALWEQGFAYNLRMIGGQDIVYHPEGLAMGDIVRNKYKSYIQEGRLILENRIRPALIKERLRHAKLVVVPSTVDNLPYVVLETMAIGHIVLVSKQGGQAEIIDDGTDGFVFDHEQPDTFFTQLKRILALDTKQRASISANAKRKIAERCNQESIYDRKMNAINAMKPTAATIFPFVHNMTPAKTNTAAGKEGLLSIVVTYYNSGIYLDEVMKCLSEIDYKKHEIFIVDDGSPDPYSIGKLKAYEAMPGVKVITKTNKGLADTRNVGAEAATGEFLAFLDVDDKVSSSYYSKAIRVLKQYSNVHFVGAWTQYFEGSTNAWPTFSPEPPLIFYHNTINSAALVYRRDAYLQGGKNTQLLPVPGLEDYESVIALLSKGYYGVSLPELLFQYRVRPDSMVRGISTTKRLLVWQYISEKYRRFIGDYADEVLSLANANGPGIALDNPTLDLDLADKLPFGGKFTLKMARLVKKNKRTRQIAYKLYRFLKK